MQHMDLTDKRKRLENEIRVLEQQVTTGLHFSFNDMALNSSMLSDVDVEINRSRNKLKYMEAQLFSTGTPSGKSSGH